MRQFEQYQYFIGRLYPEYGVNKENGDKILTRPVTF